MVISSHAIWNLRLLIVTEMLNILAVFKHCTRNYLWGKVFRGEGMRKMLWRMCIGTVTLKLSNQSGHLFVWVVPMMQVVSDHWCLILCPRYQFIHVQAFELYTFCLLAENKKLRFFILLIVTSGWHWGPTFCCFPSTCRLWSNESLSTIEDHQPLWSEF
jgi:hypothetical protein